MEHAYGNRFNIENDDCSRIKYENRKALKDIGNKVKEKTDAGPSKLPIPVTKIQVNSTENSCKNSRRIPPETEYENAIFEYMKELEKENTIVKNFLNEHSVTQSMRSATVKWLMKIAEIFSARLETLCLTVDILDKYLQKCIEIRSETLKVVGFSAFFIAMKYEEGLIITFEDSKLICDEELSTEDVLKMERNVLKELDYNVTFPSSIVFLRGHSKRIRATQQQHALAKCLLKIMLLEYEIRHILPSIQAAAASCLSIAVLKNESDFLKIWTVPLIHQSSYNLNDFYTLMVFLAKKITKQHDEKYDLTEKYKIYLDKKNLISLETSNVIKKLAEEECDINIF